MNRTSYDEIHVKNLEVFASHGVFPEETRLGQKFLISLTMYVDTRPAGLSDRLEQSVHYGEVSAFMTTWMKERRRNRCAAGKRPLLHPFPKWPETNNKFRRIQI